MEEHNLKEMVRAEIRSVLGTETEEMHTKKEAVVKHLAENMSVIDLRHLCVKEAASMIECYAMGNTEGMLHEFYELKLAVCALAEHLPEMLPEVAKKKAVDGYYSMFVKE